MSVLIAAILRVPCNMPMVSNEKQVSSHEVAELDVRYPLLELETKY